jgi:hypothetical protein
MLVAVTGVAVFDLPDVFLGFLVEGFLAALRAEVISLSLVVRFSGGGLGIDIHSTNWIFKHRYSPFGQF